MKRFEQASDSLRPSAPEAGAAGDTAVEELLDAVRAGRFQRVPELLEPLDAAARRKALGRLKALRSEVRAWDWRRGAEVTRVRRGLYVAGAGCHTGAAAAAAWLGGSDMLGWELKDAAPVLSVLADRDPAWLAEVAGRLAGRRGVARSAHALIHALVVRSGCPAPATDGYVLGWAGRITDGRLLERLREDPQTPVLVAHALSMNETPDPLLRSGGPDAPTPWAAAVAALVAEGVLDRAGTVDGCVSRLLRGGRVRDLRFPLEVLRLLAPADGEVRERVADWIGMAADAPSPVAGYAQDVLAGLALAGTLPAGAPAEMTAAVLFRTEKKLVRAQLALVGKVLAREPGAAGGLLPAVAEAFGHGDIDVQERALGLVGGHLSAVGPQVRDELAGAAGLLGPAHREAAARLFGDALAAADAGPYEEVLPPVPDPEPVAPPAPTVEALVAELTAKGLMEEPMAFERALDGLVRHAHRDRAAVAGAVRDAFADAFYQDTSFDHFLYGPRGMDVVIAALLGLVPRGRLDQGRGQPLPMTSCLHAAMDAARDARLWEAADLIGGGTLPLLLATPTRHTGGVDPLVLVERLRVYAEAGTEPAPADLAQALLRVRREDPSAGRAAEEAEALPGTAGARLAAWLRTEAPVAARVRFLPRGDTKGQRRWWLVDRTLVEVEKRPVVREEFPSAFQWAGGRLMPDARRCHHGGEASAHWATLLPADREALAACLLPSLADAVDGDAARGVTGPLTLLAEGEGPVGGAVALLLAFGLGCRDADDRLRAVDALLVLASRGDLDAARVGGELGWLLTEGSMKPNRLADSLRTAAGSGAYRTTWAVLAPALSDVLAAPKPIRGLGELLAVAADCAERSGARGELAGLDEVASARGSSQLVAQAGRLLKALRQGAGQPPTETDRTGR